MTTRIYYPHFISSQTPQTVTIDSKSAHHIITVLRHKIDDCIILFNGKNQEYLTKITCINKKQLELTLLDKKTISRESFLTIHLIQGVSKGDRMDWVIQKATELGVSRITPILTQHTAIGLKTERAIKKQEHWENIMISACEQCGRNTLPTLDPIQSFSDILHLPPVNNSKQWILHPGEQTTNLSPPSSNENNEKVEAIKLLIGPEGGFSITEVHQAHRAGFHSLQLGPRILRTETAAIATLATIQAIYGDGFSDCT